MNLFKRVFVVGVVLIFSSLFAFADGEHHSDSGVQLNGRVVTDWTSVFETGKSVSDVDWDNGDTEFNPLLNLEAAGQVSPFMNIKFSTDFTDKGLSVEDAYVEFRHGLVPFLGKVRIGQFDSIGGLEQVTHSQHLVFQDKSLLGSLIPEHETGIHVSNTVLDWINWEASVTRPQNLALRLYGSPISGENVHLHTGVHFISRDLVDETSHSLSHDGHHESTFESDSHYNQYGFEMAVVYGPLSLQGEYIRLNFSDEEMVPQAYYAQLGYFLTGESRIYKNGVTTRVDPNREFGVGFGAFEPLVRYSWMDLDDGRRERDIAVGMNWYLNEATKVMASYSVSQSNWTEDDGFFDSNLESLLQLRFQVEFSI